MAIGGAMNLKAPAILQEFIRRTGGPKARIAILPQASSLDDTGEYYQEKFRAIGVKTKAAVVEFKTRAGADQPADLQAIRKADGIFIAGGAQLRLTILYGGTQLEQELLAAYRRGAVIAGTSAGAAVLSKLMFTYGRSGSTPRAGMAHFAAGFGFTDKIIFDQHFRQRDRLGRLLYAVAANPGLLGVGVDENTAAIVENEKTIRVFGENAVTVVDGTKISATDLSEVDWRGPVAVAGAVVHALNAGCRFEVRTRSAILPHKILLAE
jgi:cyanophycinase